MRKVVLIFFLVIAAQALAAHSSPEVINDSHSPAQERHFLPFIAGIISAWLTKPTPRPTQPPQQNNSVEESDEWSTTDGWWSSNSTDLPNDENEQDDNNDLNVEGNGNEEESENNEDELTET